MRNDPLVAQIFNLPYRRFVTCLASGNPVCPSKPSARQTSSLQYGRLKICATSTAARAAFLPTSTVERRESFAHPPIH